MFSTKPYRMSVILLVSMLTASARAPADSLVTNTGQIIVGSVTRSATSYTVQTAKGPVVLPTDQVKYVLQDHPATGAPTGSGTAQDNDAAAKSAAKKAIDPRMLNALINQGQAAMTSAQYSDARDSFIDALNLDPSNAVAGHGLGFAYMALGKNAKASDPLEVAARGMPMDRSLALALASSLVANHNPMDAVKYLFPYLQSHSKPPDETLLNALAISLSQADPASVKSVLFQQATKLYQKLNADLEATRAGKKRWGIEWMNAADVTAKQTARDIAQGQVDAAAVDLEAANARAQAAKSAVKQAPGSSGRKTDAANRIARQKQSNATTELESATAQQTKAQADFDTARKALAAAPGPSLPAEIDVDSADLALVPSTVIAPAAGSAHPAGAAAAAQAAVDPKHLVRFAVAFAIASDVLVTSADAVENATAIRVQTTDGDSMLAMVLRAHHRDGLALLQVRGAKFHCLVLATSMNAGALTCFSFPDVDLIHPTAKSLNVKAGAATDFWTVRFTTSPRIPGGPLLQKGAVVGVELADRDSDLTAVPAATLKSLTNLVQNSANQSTLTTDPRQAVMQVIAQQ